MSLLNDALRKRKEERHTSNRIPALKAGPSTRGKTIKKWGLPVGVFCLVVLVSLIGGWYYRQSVDAPSEALARTIKADTKNKVQTIQKVTPLAEAAPSAEKTMPAHRIVQPESEIVSLKKEVVSTPAVARKPSPVIPAAQPPEHKRVSSAKNPGDAKPRLKKKAPLPAPVPAEVRSNTADRNPGEAVSRLYTKAKLYHRQNRLGKAIDMYREVLKMNPDHFDALFNLTSAYLQTGAYNKAYPIAADLHLRSPDNYQATLNMAIAQIGIGRPAEAIQLLDEVAAQQNAPLFEVYFHKGVAHRHLGHLAKAIVWYKKAEQLNPSNASLFFNLAVAFDQQIEYARAVHYYQKYLQESRNSDAFNHLPETGIKERIQTLRAALSQQQSEKVQKR